MKEKKDLAIALIIATIIVWGLLGCGGGGSEGTPFHFG